MEDKHLEACNPWKKLTTITNFDKGTSSYSTRCIGENEKKNDNRLLKKMSSSSILIGTLLSQLCTILEKDPVQSKRLYYLLCDAMHRMNLIDPSYEYGGSEINKYKDAVHQLINVARATIESDNSTPIPRPLVTYVSPYRDQFRETGFIAGGGFGNVFKAVHNLDEVEYAIKKILVKPGRIKTVMNHLEEVRTLAKLNHANIVSYKQAWIEPAFSSTLPQLCFGCESKNHTETFRRARPFKKTITSDKSRESKFSGGVQTRADSSKSIDENNVSNFESNSDIVSFRGSNEMLRVNRKSDECDCEEINSRTSAEDSATSDESCEDFQVCQYSARSKQYAILYIQMALCEKTLRQWLDERSEPTPVSIVAAIAAQILCGLNYIHSLKIVHHDIKPSNIFISTSGKLQVQLGDFGLACPLQRDSHDVIVGTCMYAAPEQLKGECNPKSDIYSLGIVLLELLIPMQTSMECIKMVDILKTGKIPTTLAVSYSQWAKTISRLMQKNPTLRPSASEILQDLKIDKELIINKLQDENRKLLNENKMLKIENTRQDQIIQDQKLKIEQLQTKLAKLER